MLSISVISSWVVIGEQHHGSFSGGFIFSISSQSWYFSSRVLVAKVF